MKLEECSERKKGGRGGRADSGAEVLNHAPMHRPVCCLNNRCRYEGRKEGERKKKRRGDSPSRRGALWNRKVQARQVRLPSPSGESVWGEGGHFWHEKGFRCAHVPFPKRLL